MSRVRVTAAKLCIAFAMTVAIGIHDPAWAGTACVLPAVFSLTVEEASSFVGGRNGLVVVRSPALTAGDVIRQANDRRTLRCADLEGVAAETLAKGLLLLLAVERDGRPFALALPSTPTAAVVGAAPSAAADETTAPTARVANPTTVAPIVPVVPAAPPVAAPPVATPTALPSPAPREITLPTRRDASAELTAKAVAAAAVLGTVDEAARLVVPLAVYERRIDEAKNAIAALRIEGDGSAAVRDVIAEAFGYHETARDIRRYKVKALDHARVDQRGAGAIELPYFSDSDVPRWVARYPFLGETLQQAPRETHMLLPGEMPGRWNPDRAVELLWEHAAQTAARLGAWGAGK